MTWKGGARARRLLPALALVAGFVGLAFLLYAVVAPVVLDEDRYERDRGPAFREFLMRLPGAYPRAVERLVSGDAAGLWDGRLFLWVSGLQGLWLVGAGIMGALGFRHGGLSVASRVLASGVSTRSRVPEERALVESAALAALALGMAPPRVVVLPRETSVNLWACGRRSGDAVLGVTRGAATGFGSDVWPALMLSALNGVRLRLAADRLGWAGWLRGLTGPAALARSLRRPDPGEKVGPLAPLIGGVLGLAAAPGAWVAGAVRRLAEGGAPRFVAESAGDLLGGETGFRSALRALPAGARVTRPRGWRVRELEGLLLLGRRRDIRQEAGRASMERGERVASDPAWTPAALVFSGMRTLSGPVRERGMAVVRGWVDGLSPGVLEAVRDPAGARRWAMRNLGLTDETVVAGGGEAGPEPDVPDPSSLAPEVRLVLSVLAVPGLRDLSGGDRLRIRTVLSDPARFSGARSVLLAFWWRRVLWGDARRVAWFGGGERCAASRFREECTVVLRFAVEAGAEAGADVGARLRRGGLVLGKAWAGDARGAPGPVSGGRLWRALERLDAMSAAGKEALLYAVAVAVADDGVLSPDDVERVRLLALCLDFGIPA